MLVSHQLNTAKFRVTLQIDKNQLLIFHHDSYLMNPNIHWKNKFKAFINYKLQWIKWPHLSSQKYWQNLIKIIIGFWFPWDTHCIWGFFHWPHHLIRNSFDNRNIFCEIRNEPINIENIDKVTVFKEKCLLLNQPLNLILVGTVWNDLQITCHPSNKNDDLTQVQLA